MVPPREHIDSIFREYTAESRVLRSFTNLSNTVIQTALSGQSKFVFEILQNADDAYEKRQRTIQVQFQIQGDFFIVNHNGKGFDYNDVERICDYASQIKEVKATDLSKTGYKGLGFKSLFNLSDTIYICSNGYSFRFDKTFWPKPETKPWQVIPIWCKHDELPHHKKYSYSSPVNIILRVKDIEKLKLQLKEVIDQPDLLIFLHRINGLRISFEDEEYDIKRKEEPFGLFNKMIFFKNQSIESAWLTKTYNHPIRHDVKNIVQGGSRFIYPDKIKDAKCISFTFALKSNETFTEISKIKGLCYNTLPTQLHLMLPYHINSFFILNLDRTQLHENKWNEYLIEVVGGLQFIMLRDLTVDDMLKNYVVSLLVREIEHPYRSFAQAFSRGFSHASVTVPWLPTHERTHLLKLGEVWSDEIDFFKQDFENVYDKNICPYLIDYDVINRSDLKSPTEVKRFSYKKLFENFSVKYYPQFSKGSYVDFISYVYERLQSNTRIKNEIKRIKFLVTKNKALVPPQNALIEDAENPIPDFLFINPIDNEYLPEENRESIQEWLQQMGARILRTPRHVIQESVFNWIENGIIRKKMNINNHMEIVQYLAKNIEQLSTEEIKKLTDNFLVLNELNSFCPAKSCSFPDIVPIKELADIVSNEEKLSSKYDMNSLRFFFSRIGVKNRVKPKKVVDRIIDWIKNNQIWSIVREDNYNSIVEYVARNYFLVEHNLQDRDTLKKFPVLTKGQKFMPACDCFFDDAIPSVEGLEAIVNTNEIVYVSNDSQNFYRFLTALGVSQQISPVDLMRKSVIRWIREGTISEKINEENHHAILEYISTQLSSLNSNLKAKEKSDLKKILILTQNGNFKSASTCFWSISVSSGFDNVQIPYIDSIISSDEIISSDYDINIFRDTFQFLGVRYLDFSTICKRYTNYLVYPDNVKWFFQHLTKCWQKYEVSPDLLTKLKSSRLLAKNRKTYNAKELYSTKFSAIHHIDPNVIPILAYRYLPEDLEEELGFKTKLSLTCITHLLKAFEKRPLQGEKVATFFQILLEQLKLKSRNEIKNYRFKLLSKQNKLVMATDLYYFEEEEAECELNECYLKRISGMSHSETLELAELCRVNIIPFSQKILPVRGVLNDALKKLYLERLPVIVLQETKERVGISNDILKFLYEEIDSIKLYECQRIRVQYPFGKPVNLKKSFNKFTLHVVNKWTDFEIPIHNYLADILSVKTSIEEILDYEDFSELISTYSEEDQEEICQIQSELQALKLKKKEDSWASSHVKIEGDGDASDDEKVPSSSHSTSEDTSDDESLYVISARDMTKRASISEIKTMEKDETGIRPIKDKVTVGIKCLDTDLSETTSYPHLQTSTSDESKMNSLSLASNSLASDDLLVDFSSCEVDSMIINYETGGTQKETDSSFNNEIVRADFSDLYAHNREIKLINESITSTDNIFVEDFNGNEAKMRVCVGRYVFSLLQKHYMKKYPGSRCGLLFNTFTLQWKAHKIDLKWLNGKEDNNHPYDFELSKDGEIKQFIRVELTDINDNDSFVLSHQNMTMFIKKLPNDSKKCCSFHVLRGVNSSDGSEKSSSPLAVYKIVAM